MFPKITVGDFTPKEQIYKVLDELAEAEKELNSGNRKQFLEEMVDVIHAVYTTLYLNNYTDQQIQRTINKTIKKNRERGYYD